MISEPEVKTDSGAVIFLQSDMYSIVFYPLFEEKTVQFDYLAMVLQEYLRSLIINDIEVQTPLQVLLAKLLIHAGKFQTLQELFTYNTFSDSFEVASFLLTLAPHHLLCLQIALDILFRLEKHEKITDMLLENGFIYETLLNLSKNPHPKFDIRQLLNKAEEIGNEQLTLTVMRFIKEKSL